MRNNKIPFKNKIDAIKSFIFNRSRYAIRRTESSNHPYWVCFLTKKIQFTSWANSIASIALESSTIKKLEIPKEEAITHKNEPELSLVITPRAEEPKGVINAPSQFNLIQF